MDPIRTLKYKGHIIEVHQDDTPSDPRMDFDNLGTMVCFHRRYNLGDKRHGFSQPDEAKAHIKETRAVWLPVFLYDHSGLTINTTGFSCPWDSGQVGYIYCERDKILKAYGSRALTRSLRTRVEGVLRSEVETYNQMLTGDVYGYVIKDAHESCWGFYGDIEYCIDEAKSMVDYLVKQAAQKHQTKVKAWVRNRVPLEARTA